MFPPPFPRKLVYSNHGLGQFRSASDRATSKKGKYGEEDGKRENDDNSMSREPRNPDDRALGHTLKKHA